MATLEILSGTRAGEQVKLTKKSSVIGSADGAAEIVVADPDVEDTHARIYCDGGGVDVTGTKRFFVEDMQSLTGVRVNDRQVFHKSLRDGDEIAIGAVTFRFSKNGGSVPAPASSGAESAPLKASVGDNLAQMVLTQAAKGTGSAKTSISKTSTAKTSISKTSTAKTSTAKELGMSSAIGSPEVVGTVSELADSILSPLDPMFSSPEIEVPDASQFATPDELRKENDLLRERVGQLERALRKKMTGFSLATDSFVEQLERANSRLKEAAAKQAAAEELQKRNEERIARLEKEKEALDRGGNVRVLEMASKLDHVRRDFEEIERLLRAKGQAYVKLVQEAREVTRKSLAGLPAVPGDPTATAIPGSPTSTPGAGPVAVDLDAIAAEGNAPAAAPTEPPGTRTVRLRGGPRRARADALKVGMIFALLFIFAFMLLALVQWGGDNTRGRAGGPPRTASAGDKGRTDPKGGPREFGVATKTPMPKASDRPAAAATPNPSKKPKPSGTTKVKPAKTAVTAAAAPSAAEGGADLLDGLRKAHRSRDQARIEREEKALIEKGAGILDDLRKAYDAEKQFNIKVSLQFVINALDGKGGVQGVLDSLRSTSDAGEKMRLAFMLLKFNAEEDISVLEQALLAEQDPMIKKYIVRAFGKAEGGAGVSTLMNMARGGGDRNLRIESIRALESRAEATGNPGEIAGLFQQVAQSEDDAQIRSISIRALGKTGNRDQADFFRGILQEDDRTNNRAEAAKFFARVGTAADLPQLQSINDQERVYYIRQKVKKAIDQIKKREGL